MRALLIINPRATSITGHDTGLVVRGLASRLDLRTVETRYRAHAREIAAASAADGYDLLLSFGGDGTVNEVVNGLMSAGARDAGGRGGAAMPSQGTVRGPGCLPDPGSPAPGTLDSPGTLPALGTLPAIAPIPGGGANVFARSLGLPADPVAAARQIASAAAAGTARTIGLGLAGDRYFTFSAGIGLDAEVVADVERRRASGRHSSTLLYMWTTLRRYYLGTDRRNPALTLEIPGQPPVGDLFMGVVTNSSPWTYLGSHPVIPAPHPDFNSGLDVFALRRLRTLTTLSALRQMLHTRDRPPSGRDVVAAADHQELTFRSRRPIAFHIDGEYIGEPDSVVFRFVPAALRVMALRRQSVTSRTPVVRV
ncbi:MAG: diacylglycerol kinase family lipid kinase [Streptosporangiaceae bacterium]|nr:diacylglycerol kinase family lipid kinase [Streptosporangiaceae bacterium]MBV9854660.1 diacylglycerol kinase family lipid kinase [Streptosporangiaceae bacterium]